MNYCNKCEYFKHEVKYAEVGRDYQGPAHPATSDPENDEKVIHELLCLCTKTDNRLIKNLGTELMEKEFEVVSEKAKEIEQIAQQLKEIEGTSIDKNEDLKYIG